MRLFCAVELPDATRHALTGAIEALRTRAERAGVDARWTAGDNLHVTMWFFGELEEQAASALQAALAPPFREAAFEIRVGKTGAFPPSGPPRILWAGLEDGAEEMRRLHAALAARLAPLNYLPDRPVFHPHVTLARVRNRPTRAAGQALRQLALPDLGPAAVVRVGALTLFRSRLSPQGSRYEPLLRVPLDR